MACLDTTLLIDLSGRGGRDRRQRARRKVTELYDRDPFLATTRLNVAELWVGIERSADPKKEKASVDRLLAPLVILEFDERSAIAFGRLTAHLQERGRPVGDMDVLIAAVAVVHGQAVVTRNPKHFANIPGVSVESY